MFVTGKAPVVALAASLLTASTLLTSLSSPSLAGPPPAGGMAPDQATTADGTWSVVPPPQREGHIQVYDPIHDQMIIFGGEDGQGAAGIRADVWVLPFGTSEWSELTV